MKLKNGKKIFLKNQKKNTYLIFSKTKQYLLAIVFILVKINIVESDKNQSNLLKIIVELNNKSTPRSKEGKD